MASDGWSGTAVDGRLRVAVGLGCQRGVALSTLESALAQALRPLGAVEVCCVASHAGKSAEPALLALAGARGWPLRLFAAADLAAVAVPHRCARAAGEVGTPSVAEAAALLAAGSSALLVEKQVYRGADGKGATVAVARVATIEWGQRSAVPIRARSMA